MSFARGDLDDLIRHYGGLLRPANEKRDARAGWLFPISAPHRARHHNTTWLIEAMLGDGAGAPEDLGPDTLALMTLDIADSFTTYRAR